MKFLLGEDDLSLINGLSFAIKKQGYIAVYAPAKRIREMAVTKTINEF